jgi:hypothetical protein
MWQFSRSMAEDEVYIGFQEQADGFYAGSI